MCPFLRFYLILSALLAFIQLDLGAQEPIAQQEDFNVSFLSNRQIEYPLDISSQYHRYADIWGYTAEDGTEYAILGTGIGTAIYNLTDPANPSLSALVPGVLSRWRDYKSFGHYLYGVADEGSDGLLIINMSQAPDSITWSFWKPSLTIGNDPDAILAKCHNLYIDSTFVFLAGCNLHGGGVLIFDLSDNPEEPEFITSADRKYAHDVYVREDRMFTSDLGEGFTIVDISDIENPRALASQETSSDFTHNAWASDDGSSLFTTDERSHATIDAYDISNEDEIRRLDRYRPTATLRNPVIPHNVHYHNGYLVISYYVDGLKIVDAHEPDNMVEVGSYDTYRFRDDGFHGAWGAFPFLPSGLVLISDIQTGLYVVQPQYERASYLQGLVTDQVTGAPLAGVKIEIVSERPGLTSSEQDGSYKTGWAGDGLVIARYSKDGYAPVHFEVSLTRTEYSTLDVQMVPLSRYSISGIVSDSNTGLPIQNAQVIVFNDLYEERTTTNTEGAFSITTFEGTMTIGAGKWGYQHAFIINDIQSDQPAITLTLDTGYRDDFMFDYGWEVTNGPRTATAQGWQKGNPRYAIYNEELSNPNGDLKHDFGKECYVTGLAGTLGANLADTSILISPLFDITTFNDPFINYFIWFYDVGVSPGDDELQIFLGDGTQEVLIENISTSMSGWRERSEIRIRDFITPGNTMYLKIVAADIGNVHIYEAAIDAFSITEGKTTSSVEVGQISKVIMYPNPLKDILMVDPGEISCDEIKIYDIRGQLILTQSHTPESPIHLGHLSGGTYLVVLYNQGSFLGVKRIVKAH